jgi:hypothetical protein
MREDFTYEKVTVKILLFVVVPACRLAGISRQTNLLSGSSVPLW